MPGVGGATEGGITTGGGGVSTGAGATTAGVAAGGVDDVGGGAANERGTGGILLGRNSITPGFIFIQTSRK